MIYDESHTVEFISVCRLNMWDKMGDFKLTS